MAVSNTGSCGFFNFFNYNSTTMKKLQCLVCGWVYDEVLGAPEDGIAAGTRWEDVPEDWTCPDCGAPKSDFEMLEI